LPKAVQQCDRVIEVLVAGTEVAVMQVVQIEVIGLQIGKRAL